MGNSGQARRPRPWSGLAGHAHRRHPHHIAQVQAGVGPSPALVHPHLTAADDAVDKCLGSTLEHLGQEIVEALARGPRRRPRPSAPAGRLQVRAMDVAATPTVAWLAQDGAEAGSQPRREDPGLRRPSVDRVLAFMMLRSHDWTVSA